MEKVHKTNSLKMWMKLLGKIVEDADPELKAELKKAMEIYFSHKKTFPANRVAMDFYWTLQCATEADIKWALKPAS